MGNLHALWSPSRARCVDDVCEVLCRCTARRVCVDDLLGGRDVRIDQDSRDPRDGQSRRQAPARHQHPGMRILQHESKPLRRVGRIEGHVGTAGFEDAEQPHHHIERALHAYTHERLRAYPQRL